MPWRNIQRNLSVGSIIALVGNTKTSTADKLYAIVNVSGGLPARFYRLTGAQQSPAAIWSNSGLANLPDKASAITVSGFAYNPDMDQIYVVNSAQGKVYVWNDLTNSWGVTWSGSLVGSTSWNGYSGVNARLRQIVYSNGSLYLAHRSGVSSLNTRVSGSAWTLAAEFTSPQLGPGNVTGLAVQNNVVYATVENYNTVYKNNNTLLWDKVAIFPDYSVNPQYLAPSTILSKGIFVTADDINTNLYSTDKIESATTPEPTFRDGLHLSAPASSILTSKDGITWVTTSTANHTSDTISSFGNNLITNITNVAITDPLQGNNEVISSRFHDTADVFDTTSLFAPYGKSIITSTINPADSSIGLQSVGVSLAPANIIEYSRTYYTEPMTLLPDTDYQLTFGATGDSSVTFPSGKPSVYFGAYFHADVGIAGTGLNSFDASIPSKGFDLFPPDSDFGNPAKLNNSLTFINQEACANVFEFSSNNLATRNNVRLRIVVKFSITRPGLFLNTFRNAHDGNARAGTVVNINWTFNLKLKSLLVSRKSGTALVGKTQFSPTYIAQEFSQVPQADIRKHLITSPTPPDNWFIRFNAPQQSDITTFRYTEIDRQVALNPMTLKPNTTYRININVLRDRAINSSVPLKFTITPSVDGLSSFQAVIDSASPYPIVWQFTTPNLPALRLQNVVFLFKAFEEGVSLGEAAPVLFSDIAVFELSSGTPSAAVQRIVNGALDSTFANFAVDASNNPVTFGDTYNLIETYETASQAYRKYLLSTGNAYVWEIDNSDPFDHSRLARCIICC